MGTARSLMFLPLVHECRASSQGILPETFSIADWSVKLKVYTLFSQFIPAWPIIQFQVIERVEKLRSLLTQPSNLRVHVAADVNRLPDNPHMLWKTKLLPDASVPVPTRYEFKHISISSHIYFVTGSTVLIFKFLRL